MNFHTHKFLLLLTLGRETNLWEVSSLLIKSKHINEKHTENKCLYGPSSGKKKTSIITSPSMRTRSILRSNSIPTTSHTVTYIICCNNFLFSCDYIPVQPENTLFPVGNIFNFPHLTGLPLMITSRKWYLNSDFLKKKSFKRNFITLLSTDVSFILKKKKENKKIKTNRKTIFTMELPLQFLFNTGPMECYKKKGGNNVKHAHKDKQMM